MLTAGSLLNGNETISRKDLYSTLNEKGVSEVLYGEKLRKFADLRQTAKIVPFFGIFATAVVVGALLFLPMSQHMLSSFRGALPLMVVPAPVLGLTIILSVSYAVCGVKKEKEYLKEKLGEQQINEVLDEVTLAIGKEKKNLASSPAIARLNYLNKLEQNLKSTEAQNLSYDSS